MLLLCAVMSWRSTAAQHPASAPRDRSSLTVVIDDARLLLIDPQGARTGLDPASGKEVKEIPESVVFVDRIDNDVTGEVATSFTVQVIVDQPAEGTYHVVVVGLSRPSELAVDAYSSDGSAQPQVSVPMKLEEMSRTEFQLHFLKAPSSKSRLEKIAGEGPK